MDNILIILKVMIRRIFKEKMNWLFYIILPIVVTSFILTNFSYGGYTPKFALVDKSNTVSSKSLIETIEDTDKYEFIEVEESDIRQMISDDEVLFGLVIDEKFEQNILSKKSPNIELVFLEENEASAWMKVTVDYQIQNLKDLALAADYNKNAFIELVDSDFNQIEFTKELIKDNYSKNRITTQAMGMFLMLILIASFASSGLVNKEKRMGTYDRISLVPRSELAYNVANLLFCYFLLAVQIVVVLLFLNKILDFDFNMPLLTLFLIIFTFGLATVSLGVMISAFTTTMKGSGAITTLIVTPTCMLGGCFWPVEFLPTFLEKLSFLTPQRWTLKAIEEAQNNQFFYDNLLVLLGFALLFMVLSIYKRKIIAKTA